MPCEMLVPQYCGTSILGLWLAKGGGLSALCLPPLRG